MSMYSLWVWFR